MLGGSQGANFFNEKLMKVLEKANFQKKLFSKQVEKAINSLSNIKQVEYIDEIEDVFAQTKFVICRSGASTVAELQTYAMPAIFIPILIQLMIIRQLMQKMHVKMVAEYI